MLASWFRHALYNHGNADACTHFGMLFKLPPEYVYMQILSVLKETGLIARTLPVVFSQLNIPTRGLDFSSIEQC